MTAASVAALTVYDMVKGVERDVTIGGVRLLAKSGGKSGEWVRSDRPGSSSRSRRPGARSAGRIAKTDAPTQSAVIERTSVGGEVAPGKVPSPKVRERPASHEGPVVRLPGRRAGSR